MGGTYAPISGYSSSSGKPIIRARIASRCFSMLCMFVIARASVSCASRRGCCSASIEDASVVSARARSSCTKSAAAVAISAAAVRSCAESTASSGRPSPPPSRERAESSFAGAPTPAPPRRSSCPRRRPSGGTNRRVLAAAAFRASPPRASVPLTPFQSKARSSRRRTRSRTRRRRRRQIASLEKPAVGNLGPVRHLKRRPIVLDVAVDVSRTTRTRSDQTATRPRYPKRRTPG